MVEMMPPLPPDVARGEKKKPKITMRTKRLCAEFASRLARYTQDNLPRLQELITEVEEANENEVETDIIPTEIDNRTEDKLTPLFVLAYAAGPAWWKRMENAWRMLNPAKTREELRPGVQLLRDLRDLFSRDGARGGLPRTSLRRSSRARTEPATLSGPKCRRCERERSAAR